MPESERKQGARAWQDHFVDKPLSKECPRVFKKSLKSLTICHSSGFEIASDLHVDKGYMTRPAEKLNEVFAYLEVKLC